MALRNKQHMSNIRKHKAVEYDDDSGEEREQLQQQTDTIQFLIGLLEKVKTQLC